MLQVRRPLRDPSARDRQALRLRPVQPAGPRRQGQGLGRHCNCIDEAVRHAPREARLGAIAAAVDVSCLSLLTASCFGGPPSELLLRLAVHARLAACRRWWHWSAAWALAPGLRARRRCRCGWQWLALATALRRRCVALARTHLTRRLIVAWRDSRCRCCSAWRLPRCRRGPGCCRWRCWPASTRCVPGAMRPGFLPLPAHWTT